MYDSGFGTLRQEMALACRALRRTPGYATAAIAMIAIGVAAGATLFTVYKGALLDPWPYEGGDRILVFRGSYPLPQRPSYPLWSAADIEELRTLDRVFDHVIAGRGRDVNLAGPGGAERVLGAALTPNAFGMLGIPPLHGRVLEPRDARPGADPTVVVGHALWQRRYGADPAVVGRTIDIDGTPHIIAGIMPPRFRWWDSQLWFPLALDPAETRRDARPYVVQARLRSGVSLEQATAALDTWARRVELAHAAEYPEYRGWRVHISRLGDAVLGNVGGALRVLMIAVAALVLVAAFNVANLLLARAAGRRREFAVRAALGASFGRMVRVLFAENLLVATIGGILGLAGAAFATGLVVGLIPYGYFSAEANIDLDIRVVGLAVGLALVVALFAVMPSALSLRSLRLDAAVRRPTGSDTKTTVRLRSAFVVGQLALTAAVVAGAWSAGVSFRTLLSTDAGFAAAGAVSMRVSLPVHVYPERSDLRAFALALESLIGRSPGVQAAAIGVAPPLAGGGLHPLSVRGRAADPPGESRYEVVTADWFDALGVPAMAGRVFDERDRAGTGPVAVVNETFARVVLDGGNPIGVQVRAGPGAGERDWLTIVGVVGDVRVGGLDGEVRPLVYQPLAQAAATPRNPVVLVRGDAPADALVGAVRHSVAALDPAVPVFDVARFEDIAVNSMGGHRLAAVLLGGFAATAVLLAALGIYGIIAWVIHRSRAELALRMAVGASRADIVRLVGRRSVWLAVAGAGAGIVPVAVALRLVSTALEQPAPDVLPVLAATSVLLASVVAAASAGPAISGAQTDPATALRDG